jgi:hypothetical protein
MLLYSPNGDQVPGFDRVIFAKGASEKLASVGDLCDASLVCVFDDKGLKTYKASEVSILGKPFTTDTRDAKTRLYPLSLYRKKGETMSNMSVPDSEKVEASELCKWDDLPALAHEAVVIELLAKTYVKEGLSKLDRYHAKLGDIGIKAMKKEMPNLKVPKKYRCECCIDAKMHKFGHSRVPVEGRIKYAPGTCIHSDHSGPYARSIGGCRYSQLYMDMGSGFLWAVRMAKKSGHYDATPRVIADARAASGKRLQYFQSDGEGVLPLGKLTACVRPKKFGTSPTRTPLLKGPGELFSKAQQPHCCVLGLRATFGAKQKIIKFIL